MRIITQYYYFNLFLKKPSVIYFEMNYNFKFKLSHYLFRFVWYPENRNIHFHILPYTKELGMTFSIKQKSDTRIICINWNHSINRVKHVKYLKNIFIYCSVSSLHLQSSIFHRLTLQSAVKTSFFLYVFFVSDKTKKEVTFDKE